MQSAPAKPVRSLFIFHTRKLQKLEPELPMKLRRQKRIIAIPALDRFLSSQSLRPNSKWICSRS